MRPEKIEEMMKFFESPEGQKKLDEYYAKREKQELEKKQNIRNLFVTDEYMNWVSNYLIDKEYFHDDWWFGYIKEELPKKDSEHIDKLYDFYIGISEYANNIEKISSYYNKDSETHYYIIKFKDKLFKFALYKNPEANIICSNLKPTIDVLTQHHINFTDISEYYKSKDLNKKSSTRRGRKK